MAIGLVAATAGPLGTSARMHREAWLSVVMFMNARVWAETMVGIEPPTSITSKQSLVTTLTEACLNIPVG
jgi:hypothetical protein